MLILQFLWATPHKKSRAAISALCENESINKQISLASLNDELAQVRTKKKEFLDRMERVHWVEIIKPHYNKGERGNKPCDLELLLRIHVLQNLYHLSDEAASCKIIDSRAFSDFCAVEPSNQDPDGDTISRFRNILVKNKLGEKIFTQVVTLLLEKGLLLRKGTIVDSTFVEAPSCTKRKSSARPMRIRRKKGNNWHFGYNAYVGVDRDSGLIHNADITAANVGDVNEMSKPLTSNEEIVQRYSGYLDEQKKPYAILRNKQGKKIEYKINRHPSQLKKLSLSGQYYAR